MEDQHEGMSKTKKVATGAAVGLATTAAVGVARKLMSDDDGDAASERQEGRDRRTTGQRRATSTGRPRSAKRPTRAARSSKPRAGGAEPTKEQLYREAKRLDIDGRSKMDKTQLKRAIGRARS